jgi:hypothetical protein
MNERLKELVKQANGITYDDDGNELTLALVGKELEIFAELIVRECIRYFNEDYNRNFATLWREDLSIGVKQHFGVKE